MSLNIFYGFRITLQELKNIYKKNSKEWYEGIENEMDDLIFSEDFNYDYNLLPNFIKDNDCFIIGERVFNQNEFLRGVFELDKITIIDNKKLKKLNDFVNFCGIKKTFKNFLILD